MRRRPLQGAPAAFVARQRVAHLATVAASGAPHVVPVSTVLDADRVIFATETDTQKVRNLRGDPNVAMCFDEYSEEWSSLQQVVVYGRAAIVESGPEFLRDRNLLYEAYEQYEAEAPIDEGDSVIVEVSIDRVSTMGL
ncbi:MAG: TIGR03618 family F420-dependent PPOX class oxidoreductase [Actinomycetota bacterium]|nr:TIGR03618 family F420-dependent PPOX class oxidoreductase [Actinomycetota bacterium]